MLTEICKMFPYLLIDLFILPDSFYRAMLHVSLCRRAVSVLLGVRYVRLLLKRVNRSHTS